MKYKKRASIAAALLLGAMAVVWLASTFDQRSSGDPNGFDWQPTAADAYSHGAQDTTEPQGVLADEEQREASPKTGSREEVRLLGCEGKVQSFEGRPVSGALVSWVPLDREDTQGDPRWERIARIDSNSESLLAITDAEGCFEFDRSPLDRGFGSTLWATHPEHYAGLAILGSEEERRTTGISISLQMAAPITVRVVDSSGLPIAGADVEQLAVIPSDQSPPEQVIISEWRARCTLARSASTGANGIAIFGPFSGEQVFRAISGKRLSRAWRGEARDAVELVLADSFTVEGSISYPEWAPGYTGERRITFSCQEGPVVRTLATLRSVAEGPWGPIELPVLAVDGYVIRVEGSPIIPHVEYFSPPLPGDRLEFDIETRMGEELWFQAIDESEEPIPGSWVELTWNEGGVWSELEVQAREDTHLNVWSVPHGTVYYQVFASGYAPSIQLQLGVPIPEPMVHMVILQRSGKLTGRCTYQDEPVEDFEVVVWPVERTDKRAKHTFEGREDGSFVIEDVPATEIYVVVGAIGHPGSEPVAVEVPVEGTTHVELALSEVRVAQGLVIDAITREPLPEATVQFYYTGVAHGLTRWGPKYPVGLDGRFEVAGFTERESFFFAEAPGYSGYYSSVGPGTDAATDIGMIPLERQQTLHFSLTDWDPQAVGGFLGFQFRAHGPTILPGSQFPDDGVLRFENVSTGEYNVTIDHPDNLTSKLSLSLAAGETWNIDHQVRGGKEVAVVVLPESGSDLDDEYTIWVEFTSNHGRGVTRVGGFPGDEPAVFSGITGTYARATVVKRGSGEILGVKSARIGAGPITEIPIRLGARELTIRVVDKSGQVVPQVLVLIRDPGDRSIHYSGTTNAEGETIIRGVPESEVSVDLRRGALGQQQGIRCDASRDEVELLFLYDAQLDLRVTDGDAPLEGALCSLVSAYGTLDSTTPTDGSGHARFTNLGPGPYDLHAERSDCWPVDQRVEVHEDGGQVELQMRRLGGLAIEVASQEGIRVAGQHVGIRSIEFDVDVAHWLDSGRVRCATGLTTDGQGETVVEGLPHGPYRWSVVSDAGETLTGTVEVPVGQTAELLIVLP